MILSLNKRTNDPLKTTHQLHQYNYPVQQTNTTNQCNEAVTVFNTRTLYIESVDLFLRTDSQLNNTDTTGGCNISCLKLSSCLFSGMENLGRPVNVSRNFTSIGLQKLTIGYESAVLSSYCSQNIAIFLCIMLSIFVYLV